MFVTSLAFFKSSAEMLFPGVTFNRDFFCVVCFSFWPRMSCSSCTKTEDTLDEIWFSSSWTRGAGTRCSTGCLFKGWMPHFMNPLLMLAEQPSLPQSSTWSLPSSLGNSCLLTVRVRFPTCTFQSYSIFLHFFFIGAKKATSRGWRRWVELGGRQINLMSCWAASCNTVCEKWLDKLSPRRTFGPFRCRMCGRNMNSNQSVKQVMSNHPLLLRLYLVPLVPPSIHVDHKFSALYTT